ncbi:MAG: hypothetical protein ACK5RA_12645 [Cyanobacteriota bacterium]
MSVCSCQLRAEVESLLAGADNFPDSGGRQLEQAVLAVDAIPNMELLSSVET